MEKGHIKKAPGQGTGKYVGRGFPTATKGRKIEVELEYLGAANALPAREDQLPKKESPLRVSHVA